MKSFFYVKSKMKGLCTWYIIKLEREDAPTCLPSSFSMSSYNTMAATIFLFVCFIILFSFIISLPQIGMVIIIKGRWGWGRECPRPALKCRIALGQSCRAGFNYRYEDEMAVKMNVSLNPLHVGSVHK